MPTDQTAVIPPINLFMATVNTEALARWMQHTDTKDEDQAIHRTLVETCGSIAPKPYRLIKPRNQTQATTLYGYTTADAEVLQANVQAHADPLQAIVLPYDSIITKPMPNNWKKGERFGFNIRARPINRSPKTTTKALPQPVRRANEPRPRHVSYREDDAYAMDVASRRDLNLPPRDMRSVYAEWLKDLFAQQTGALIDPRSVTILSFRKTPKNHKHPDKYTGPDAVMQGVLTVNDPEAFARLLSKGIGRHKAYGYGMLMIRPVLN